MGKILGGVAVVAPALEHEKVFGSGNDPGHELSADEDSFYETEHRLEVVPDAGHFVQRQQPERLTELILDWFEKE